MIEEIDVEEKNFENDLIKWIELADKGASMYDRIEQAKLDDYIKGAIAYKDRQNKLQKILTYLNGLLSTKASKQIIIITHSGLQSYFIPQDDMLRDLANTLRSKSLEFFLTRIDNDIINLSVRKSTELFNITYNVSELPLQKVMFN